MDNAAGAEGRREILEAVRDGGLSARAAAAALKATRSGASAQQGAVQGTAPVGWFSPQWRADSLAPVASGERAGVIVAGLDHPTAGVSAARPEVDQPVGREGDGADGGGLGARGRARWRSRMRQRAAGVQGRRRRGAAAPVVVRSRSRRRART